MESHVTSPEAVMLLPNKLTVVSWLRGISTLSSNVSLSLTPLRVNGKHRVLRDDQKEEEEEEERKLCDTHLLPLLISHRASVCLSACQSEVWGGAWVPLCSPCNLAVRHTYRPRLVTWQAFGGGGGWDGRRKRGRERGWRFLNIKRQCWIFLGVW